MKKYLIPLLCIIFFIAGCGDTEVSQEVEEAKTTTEDVISKKSCTIPESELIPENTNLSKKAGEEFTYKSRDPIQTVIQFFENNRHKLEIKQFGTHIRKVYLVIVEDYDITVVESEEKEVEIIYQCRKR